MFQQQPQKGSYQPQWRNKQEQFVRQSARKDRASMIQSQRYLNFSEVVNWKMNIQNFRLKVQSSYNYYTLLNTLFAISQEPNWRQFIPHMQVLVSSFHNIMCQKRASNIQDIVKIKDFQANFRKVFQLKDLGLHKHLILLLKMLLAYNTKCLFLNQQFFSQILAESTTYNNTQTISQILWIMAQIKVSNVALVKLFKLQNLIYSIQKSETCLLPFLTILVNFLSYKNENPQVVEQLVTSQIFQKAFNLGLHSKKIKLSNQTLLIFNNGLCFSPIIRNYLLKQKKTLETILSIQCEQRYHTQQILMALGIFPMKNNHLNFNLKNELNMHQNSTAFEQTNMQ